MKKLLLVLTGFVVICFVNNFVFADEYVKVTKAKAVIYFGPTTTSAVIAQAHDGDIFELAEATAKWYKINLFSGQSRYLLTAYADRIEQVPELPESERVRKEILQDLATAQAEADEGAEEKYPDDEERQSAFKKILADKYKLAVFQKYNLASANYNQLIAEAVIKNK